MRAICTAILLLTSVGAGSSVAVETSRSQAVAVQLNSVGYLPESLKFATVDAIGKEFAIRDIKTDAEVMEGQLLRVESGSTKGSSLLVDFSALKREGAYEIKIRGGSESSASSAQFFVGKDVYNWPFYCVFRAMYLWRCGCEVSGEVAGRHYEHAACHLEDAYLNYIGGPKDKRHDAIGGWHDAGDYNKYTINAAFTVGTMLKAWEHFREKLAPLMFDIPESGNQTPDFLDEVRWELDWLLKMQAADGSVHHKVSALKFEAFVMPEKDTERRYFCPWSSTATADFAAIMAEASRAIRPFDAPYSSRCLAAAKKSYEFLQANPADHRPDLSAFSTGGYNASDADARLWAAAELWETTGETRFLHDFEQRVHGLERAKGKGSRCVDVDWDWANLRNLGAFTYLLSARPGKDPSIVARIKEDALHAADTMVTTARRNPYGRPLGSSFHWGCNGTVARQAMNLQVAYLLTGEQRYRDTLLDAVNYLFGRNPFGRSFITGLGHRPPMHPHDRRSGADNVDAPWPGYLVGGAWPKETNWYDDEGDYRTNEFAINWNGALIYALAAVAEPQNFDESIKSVRDIANPRPQEQVMDLQPIDIAIILTYMLGMIVVGFVVERRARGGIENYFLGGHKMPWWILSMSNAASMFDVSGTMWLVSLLYVYGMKSVFIPWLWPVFNQIFLMVYLSSWLRRSKATTGAEWITLRFGQDRGAEASRISVVVFALVSVVAFTGYAFVGISVFSSIFLPKALPPSAYALIIVGVTTLYTVVGGLYSVVLTDVIQFVIKLVCCILLGGLAMWKVSPTMLQSVVPPGWTDISFGWTLDLDWSKLLPAAQSKITSDGYTLFGAFFMMAVFKGILVSTAGPAPNYDMQRILAAKNPREAAMMSGLVTVVLFVPRYFMIAGITVLALAFMHGDVTKGADFDLEQVLPIVIRDYLPAGLAGLLIAGLLAAFMSTFSGTINAAAAYLVNDVYKRYLRPEAGDHEYIRASYFASIFVVIAGCTAGLFMPSVAKATDWIVSGLWVGYAAPNVLKWHWWRLNGFGYFWGMITGIGGAVLIAIFPAVRHSMAQPAVWLISQWVDASHLSVDWTLMAVPTLLVISLVGTVGGSLLTKPEDPTVLLDFYMRTRPWGWWGPIRELAVLRDPDFRPNRDFGVDVFNVLIGIAWQTSFVALPIYVVIRQWHEVAICLAIVAVTSAILKRTWYDRLQVA